MESLSAFHYFDIFCSNVIRIMKMLDINTKNVLFCNIFLACVRASELTATTQDSMKVDMEVATVRANTLFDNADDIQKQLDNEARDKMKYAKPKTIWVFHYPTPDPGFPTDTFRPHRQSNLLDTPVTDVSTESVLLYLANDRRQWNYKDQNEWGKWYPNCNGRSQSPVDVPADRLVRTRGARGMIFSNYDVMPQKLTLVNDGISVKLHGKWSTSHRPTIYGGAAHSRRYLFDHISLHWPSEHTVSGLQYPLESQALFVSAEYTSVEAALSATNDKMAVLGVSSLFTFSNRTHKGLREMLKAALSSSFGLKLVSLHPMRYFNPPFAKYASYHGSLTTPPCSESVLWLIRARSMPVTRELMEVIQEHSVDGEKQGSLFRQTHPLNDRKVFYFN